MVRVVCRACRYARDLTRREAEFGMMCPNCHSQKLRPPVRARQGHNQPSLRPLTVRTLFGAVFCLFTGPLLLAATYPGLAGRSDPITLRLFALGILLLIAGVIALITGLVGVYRDFTQD